MTDEFATLMSYSKEMHRRLFHARAAFYAYEGLLEATAPNKSGKKRAPLNAKILANYKDFLIPAKESLRVYFFLELAKLFDASDQSLHVTKILNFTESNLMRLSMDAFKEYNKDQSRAFLDDLVSGYKGMNRDEVLGLRTELRKRRILINRLKRYRDQWLAHADIKQSPTPPKLTGRHIRILFALMESILNKITGAFNSETWQYSHIERDAKHHVKLLFDHLRRFEPYRLKEIEQSTSRLMRRYRIKEPRKV